MRQLGTVSLVILFNAASLVAQDSGKAFRQAPLGVEDALKSRVMEFFNLQQEGKFRQAEAFVCEDTKDHYYNMDKQRHKGAQFVKIFFEEDFKSAKAQVNLDVDLNTFNGAFPAKFPMMSFWRVEGDNWCYFIPKRNQDYYATPFGMMKRDPNAPRGATPPSGLAVSAEMVRSAVKASRSSIEFDVTSGGSEEEILLHNTLAGEVALTLSGPEVSGLTASLAKSSLSANEQTALKVSFKPASSKPLQSTSLRLTADPMGQVIEIQVSFRNRAVK